LERKRCFSVQMTRDLKETQSRFIQKKVQVKKEIAEEIKVETREQLIERLYAEKVEGVKEGPDLARLKPATWLNDELVNAYRAVVNKRTAQNSSKHAFVTSTFFFTMLENMHKNGDYNFRKLDRSWISRKLSKDVGVKSLWDLKLLLVPININKSHWLMSAIDLQAGKYYIVDSMPRSTKASKKFHSLLSRFM